MFATKPFRTLVFALLLLQTALSYAEEISVAVAANFGGTLRELAAEFEEETGHVILPSIGSTGQLFAQIVNGAPYDIYLAADTLRPQQLIERGLAGDEALFVYAIGSLALLSSRGEPLFDLQEALTSEGAQPIAIANANLAPYGRAAEEVLTELGLKEQLAPVMVTGENVSQTLQFVATGNAALGFVSVSQVKGRYTNWLLVPGNLYSPIEQQGVLLTDSDATRSFVEFMRGASAQAILTRHGYEQPFSPRRR